MLDNQRLLAALADARDQLEHQALHDSLTTLPNRVLFADRLDHALIRPQANVSVMFCDVDDFKHVNDDLGHEAGDQLLREIARRLKDCVRSTDTVARLGGDEFAILLDDSLDAVQVAERIVESMKDGAVIAGHHVRTSISIGIAHHQGDAGVLEATTLEDWDEVESLPRRRTTVLATGRTASAVDRDSMATLLLRRADMAMYAAKGAGKGRAVLSDVDSVAPTLPAGLDFPVAMATAAGRDADLDPGLETEPAGR
jgi:diguanylate cyclase (GGDEF)-like protein